MVKEREWFKNFLFTQYENTTKANPVVTLLVKNTLFLIISEKTFFKISECKNIDRIAKN